MTTKPHSLRYCPRCRDMRTWQKSPEGAKGKRCDVCLAATVPRMPARRPIRPVAARNGTRTARKPIRRVQKRWCPACEKRGEAFWVAKSVNGSGYWAHEGCGCKTTPKKPSARAVRTSLAKQAKDAWSAVVKKGGRCYLEGTNLGTLDGEPHVCKGTLQACHGFGKKAHPSVRYLPINGFPMCGAGHSFYTWQPHRWEAFLRHEWGYAVYEELYRRACQTAKHDLPAIIEGLKAELSK